MSVFLILYRFLNRSISLQSITDYHILNFLLNPPNLLTLYTEIPMVNTTVVTDVLKRTSLIFYFHLPDGFQNI